MHVYSVLSPGWYTYSLILCEARSLPFTKTLFCSKASRHSRRVTGWCCCSSCCSCFLLFTGHKCFHFSVVSSLVFFILLVILLNKKQDTSISCKWIHQDLPTFLSSAVASLHSFASILVRSCCPATPSPLNWS